MKSVGRDSEGSDEEQSAAPVFQNSFGAAIQAAFENLESGKGQWFFFYINSKIVLQCKYLRLFVL